MLMMKLKCSSWKLERSIIVESESAVSTSQIRLKFLCRRWEGSIKLEDVLVASKSKLREKEWSGQWNWIMKAEDYREAMLKHHQWNSRIAMWWYQPGYRNISSEKQPNQTWEVSIKSIMKISKCRRTKHCHIEGMVMMI